MSPDTSDTIKLRDGRTLGYALWGDPDGLPLIYLSGTPGSRYEALIFADAAARAEGIRLIAPERPGSGLSSFKPGFGFADVASDVAELADHFGLARFALLAVSGGGPYALGCAYYLPERLTAVEVVSGLGPLDIPELSDGRIPLSRVFRLFRTMGRQPWLAAATYRLMSALGRVAPGLALRLLTEQTPPLDKAVLKRPQIWEQMGRYMLTAPFRHGVGGPAYEASLYARPWGFALEQIRSPVRLWHGDADVQCPVEIARYLAGRIPGVELKILPEAGHLLIVDHAREIFSSLKREQLPSLR
ncbi:MAG TPA: alpha/beta hydrolase [Candidatus Obscuribacterales bacterium]